MNHPTDPCSWLRRRANRGMTLVETMIATMVFCMGILGVYAMMLKSYELVTLARHRDNARALLVSFGDQFLRLQTTDAGTNGANNPRPLFILTNITGPTGAGLSWTDVNGSVGTIDTTNGLLQVALGDSTGGSSQVTAHVSRSVYYVNPATGDATATQTATPAGWMLQGTFTITYPIRGRIQSQSLTVARAVTTQ